MPSVDKVGRYFPLMLGGEFPAELDLARFVPAAMSWYEALEELALAALSDGFDLGRFEQPLSLAAPENSGSSPRPGETLAPPGHYIALAAGDVTGFCRDHAELLGGQRTLWWTLGSERVSPCLLICPGLPPPASFPALLDGAWSARGWPTAGPASDAPSAAASAGAGDALAWDREE
jgi:type VI secretion system protein ImpM